MGVKAKGRLSGCSGWPPQWATVATLVCALGLVVLVTLCSGLSNEAWRLRHGAAAFTDSNGAAKQPTMVVQRLAGIETQMAALGAAVDTILRNSSDVVTFHPDFGEFLTNIKRAGDAHMLPDRAIWHLFKEKWNKERGGHEGPECGKTFMEFGVWKGDTIRLVADWLSRHCNNSRRIYGFDTFSGLPETWWRFAEGDFDLKGALPVVPDNVELVPGLYNESLPVFLKQQDAAAPSGRMPDISYLHIDCDLYAGTKDALTILEDRIAPGAVIIFDDLLNYQGYQDHEVKAMWEWMGRTGRRVEMLGLFGPLRDRIDAAVELNPTVEPHWFSMSVAFKAL